MKKTEILNDHPMIKTGLELIKGRFALAKLVLGGCALCSNSKGVKSGMPICVGNVCMGCYTGRVMPLKFLMTKFATEFTLSEVLPGNKTFIGDYIWNDDDENNINCEDDRQKWLLMVEHYDQLASMGIFQETDNVSHNGSCVGLGDIIKQLAKNI